MTIGSVAVRSADEEPVLLRERRQGLVILRLNQPDRMNPLLPAVKHELSLAVDEFVRDPEQRCLLLTGTGRAFCAGGDVSTMLGEQPPLAVRARVTQSTDDWARTLMECEKPVVTAINGAAVGAGFAVALLGDVIIASEEAYFLPGFNAMGVAADLGLALTLPRAVGMPRAKNILMCNLRVTAAEAAGIGLVSETVPHDALELRAIEVGMQLAGAATVGLGLTKALLGMAYTDSLHNFFKAEGLAQATAFSTADRVEGASAFLEKRPPQFKGR